MKEREKELSSEESLRIITDMIHTARSGIRDNGFFYLLWGWLVFVSSLTQYVLIAIKSPLNYLPWSLLMPAGMIVSLIYGIRKKKAKRVKTFPDQFLGYALIGFLVSLFIVLFYMAYSGRPEHAYPFIMMVYGVWLFISGGVLQFRPLLAGGVINWVLALVSMIVPFQWQLLLLALAVLLGYIIPGHLLKASHNRQ